MEKMKPSFELHHGINLNYGAVLCQQRISLADEDIDSDV